MGGLSDGTVIAGLVTTFLLSCTLGVLLGVTAYYIISREITKCNGKRRSVTSGRNTILPIQTQEQESMSNKEYAEPYHRKQERPVELTRNKAYGQGGIRRVSATQNQELEHSYEFLDQ